MSVVIGDHTFINTYVCNYGIFLSIYKGEHIKLPYLSGKRLSVKKKTTTYMYIGIYIHVYLHRNW